MMMRPSIRPARIALVFAGLAAAVTIVWFSLDPPERPSWWTSAFVNGQLALIMVWAALGPTRCYLRWPCGVAAIWLVAQPIQSTRPDLALWKSYLVIEIVPHAMLAFTCLYVLHELGVRLAESGTCDGDAHAVRQFTLRRLFAWVAGAAVLTFVWKYVAAMLYVQISPALTIKAVLIEQLSRSITFTAIDLVALWATLYPKSLRWRQAWLALAVVLVQNAAWRYADQAVLGRPLFWREALSEVSMYDVFYLLPLVGALLLARAAGYRVTWASVEGAACHQL